MHSEPQDGFSDFGRNEAMTSLSIPSTVSLEQPMLDWARLLEEHRRWLATVVRSRLANPNAVEDVLQEVALAVLKQSNRPTEQDKVPAFLYRIAVRKVVNHHRVHGRQKRLLENYTRQRPSDSEFDTRVPGSWLFEQEQSGAIQNALGNVPVKDRELLMLKYTEGWGYRELANHLGVSVKTIEYRLLRARQSLRDAINREEAY
jgi:RNA polymerase sigma-70 factor (ECF subfamily)